MSNDAIVRAGAAHAPILAALHAASFAKAWSADEFTALLAQPGVAGWIWGDDPPAGFILVRAAADEAEVLTLAVMPSQRRKSIASQLLQNAVDVLRAGGTARMFLEVAADNAAALGLYARNEFTPCGLRTDYYGADRSRAATDAVVLMRAL